MTTIIEMSKGLSQMLADGDICAECGVKFDDKGSGAPRTCDFCVEELLKKYYRNKKGVNCGRE